VGHYDIKIQMEVYLYVIYHGNYKIPSVLLQVAPNSDRKTGNS